MILDIYIAMEESYKNGYIKGCEDTRAGYTDGKLDAVVHGRWLYDSGSGKHFCSACDEFALSYKKDRWAVGELYECFLSDFCPNCGADMRERKDDD